VIKIKFDFETFLCLGIFFGMGSVVFAFLTFVFDPLRYVGYGLFALSLCFLLPVLIIGTVQIVKLIPSEIRKIIYLRFGR
jgi:hypothetical protein